MSDDGPGTREVAYRLFAAEFDDASLSYSESDEERAPNYVVTPTGLRVNRLFAVGVLTEVERVNDDTRRGRVVDPTGAFVTYAGQYQPDEQTFLERTEPPTFVSITGKARTFEPDDSDRVFTSVRPESLNEVDAETRDRWTVTAAEATLDRLAVFAKAIESDLRGEKLRSALEAGGAPAPLAAGIPRALEHYRTSPAYLESVRKMSVDALEVVAGDRDDVRTPDFTPEEGGVAELGPLPETDVTVNEGAVAETEPAAGTAKAVESSSTAEGETATVEGEAATDESETAPVEAETEAADAEPATAEGESSQSTAESEPEEATIETGVEETVSGSTSASAETDAIQESEPSPEESEPSPEESEPSPEETDVSVDGTETEEPGGIGDFEDELETEADSDEETRGGEESSPTESTETTAESADTAADLGSFDESVSEADQAATGSETDEDMYEMDEEEREEIESEFGTDFSTGTEVEEPGEADIDVPEPEEMDQIEADAASVESTGATESPRNDSTTVAAESDVADDADATDGTTTTAEREDPAVEDTAVEDVDLEEAVVDAMTDLDEGEGADREAVVAAVVDEFGADPGDVDDAIQDALMDGQCYEPGEGTLKAI